MNDSNCKCRCRYGYPELKRSKRPEKDTDRLETFKPREGKEGGGGGGGRFRAENDSVAKVGYQAYARVGDVMWNPSARCPVVSRFKLGKSCVVGVVVRISRGGGS